MRQSESRSKGEGFPHEVLDQQYQSQAADGVGTLSLDQGDLFDLQYQYADLSQNDASLAGDHRRFPSSPLWKPAENVEGPQPMPNRSFQQAKGLQYHTDTYGLLTPVSTKAQNSPSNKLCAGTAHNDENELQQICRHTFDAALEANQASNDPTVDFFGQLTVPPEEQSWGEFDFEALNGLFGASDPTTFDHFDGGFNAAAPRQDMQLSFHRGGYVSDPVPDQLFDTWLTEMNYSNPDLDGTTADVGMGQRDVHPAFLGETAAHNTGPGLAGFVNAIDAPSPAASVARSPARGSQRNNTKNALLIEWKERGMSYKDIKARGGFEEAESTLRGRYRTLTKPKEERVRRPEWSDRDVSSLHMKPAIM